MPDVPVIPLPERQQVNEVVVGMAIAAQLDSVGDCIAEVTVLAAAEGTRLAIGLDNGQQFRALIAAPAKASVIHVIRWNNLVALAIAEAADADYRRFLMTMLI